MRSGLSRGEFTPFSYRDSSAPLEDVAAVEVTVIVFGEAQLRRLLRVYADYYNGTRTHLPLGKDAPIPHAMRRDGRVHFESHLGGLHNSLVQI